MQGKGRRGRDQGGQGTNEVVGQQTEGEGAGRGGEEEEEGGRREERKERRTAR